MILSKINNIRVAGIASAVSNNWISIEEVLEQYPDENFNLKRFKKNTGVKGHWYAGEHQTASDFCTAAAKEVLKRTNTDFSEIGVLIFVTQASDYRFPSTACVIQHRLSEPGKENDSCVAFDVNLGCSGYPYGLNIAASILSSSNSKKALLLCGDTSAKPFHKKDDSRTSHSSLYLFGDSGSATLLEKNEQAETMMLLLSTDGSGYKTIIAPSGSWRHPDSDIPEFMDDIEVFNFATNRVVGMLEEYMKMTRTTPDNYDALVLHQANLFIMNQLAKKCGFSKEKIGISIDTFANTDSASIPNTIVNMYGNEEADVNKKVLTCGFGVGLSWGTVAFEVNEKNVAPLVHTDEYFNDGYED